ncbi:hypothetical protein C5167_016255 [Papaver somniferum]|nr:hypothetical protein C5167_016255 [Papaver somniferum]
MMAGNVETFVGVIDAGTEVLEKVADGIVKVADEVAEHLPEGSPLRETVCNVYHVAQNVADSAHKADEIIHKIEKLEEEAEERLEKIREEGEEKSVEAKKEGEDEEEVKDVEKVKNENQENIVEEESKIVREPGAVVNQGITMTTATTTEVIEQKEQQQSDK